MSAIQAQLVSRQAAPHAVKSEASRAMWFPIEEAARLLDMHRANLNRRCPQLEPAGQARRMPLVLGGPQVWHIHASYSPRLVRAGVEQTEAGTSAVHERLAAATAGYRTEAARKARLVVAFRAWKIAPRGASVRDAYAGFAATHDGAPSYTRIKEWSSRCPTSNDLPGCMAALLDTRGRPPEGAPAMSEPAWSLYCENYLTPHQWSHSKCWRVVRAIALDKGWTWPSEDTVARTRDARLTRSQTDMARLGEDRWAKLHQTPIQQDPEAWAAGACWEGDNSTLDFSVRVWRDGAWKAVRPLLSLWKDKRSRRIMGWHLGERANSATIREAFVSACDEPGVGLPEHVWIDNGKDFASASLSGSTKAQRRKMAPEARAEHEAQSTALFSMLNVRVHFARAYNHNGKARIERGFSFIHQDFDREFASWCGSDEGDRPDVDFYRAAVQDVMALPTIEQAREAFGQWSAWFNARSEHAIQDMVVRDGGAPRRLSPVEFYERFLPARRVVQRETLDLLRMPFESQPRAVTKRGVGVSIDGKLFHFGGGHPAVAHLVGTDARVYVSYDDRNRREVTIYDTSFRRLCVAPMNGAFGGAEAPTEAFREAIRRQRQARSHARARPSLLDSVLRTEELAAKIAREADVARTRERLREAGHQEAAASANVRLMGTPIDHAARVASARKAVGSEHDAVSLVSMVSMVSMVSRGLRSGQDDPEYGDVLLGIAADARPCNGPANGPYRPFADEEYEISIAPQSRDEAAAMEVELVSQTPEEDDGYDVLASLGDHR